MITYAAQVNRVMLSVAALVLTLIGLALPMSSFAGSSGNAGADPVTITDYHADYRVAANGHLTATETLTTEFPADRHGIFRFWDVSDPADTHIRYVPENIHVTLDGGSVPVAMSWQTGRRYRVAKIGDPNQTLSAGQHVYAISYTIDGVLASGDSKPAGQDASSSWSSGSASRFTWRVVADGWQMPILKSSTTVQLPADPTAVSCSTGNDTPCEITSTAPNTRTVTTGQLPPSTGVAIRADLPIAAPHRTTLPWPLVADPVLGRSLPILIAVLLVSALTFTAGLLWALRSREHIPPLPVMYEPPADPQNPARPLGPVQTYFVTAETVPKRALVATLLFMADQRLVRLDRDADGTWTITSLVDEQTWARTDAVTGAVASALGLRRPNSSFQADGSVAAGKALKFAQETLSSTADEWGQTSGAITRSRFEQIGRVLLVVAFLLAAALFVFQWVPYSILVLPIAAFVIGAAGLFVSGVGTRRTRLGRDIWSRAGGFERLLSTTSNKERLDFAARKDLYQSYIPYAVAFDCAEAWAQKYRIAMGSEPPPPIWFVGAWPTGPGYAPGLMGAGGIDSFESSLSSSLSAYTASQAHSSSGGGGFGGGGFSGGGGGGGGSW